MQENSRAERFDSAMHTLTENVYSRFINAINRESDIKSELARWPLIREMSLTKTNLPLQESISGKGVSLKVDRRH